MSEDEIIEYEYCGLCGKRVPSAQIGGVCTRHGCGRKVCTDCYVIDDDGMLFCKRCFCLHILPILNFVFRL